MVVQLGYENVFRAPRGFPAWQAAGLPVESAPAGLAGLAEAERLRAPGPLVGWAMVWTLLGLFAGGLALNLTPCVYPLLPITVSYFGGRSGQARGRVVVHALFYLLGLALMNSTLGVAAALSGSLLGGLLQNPVVLIGVAAVLVLFAASLFGLWELRLPQALTRAASKSYAGYGGSLFMGLTLGLVAAPCLGPFVLGLLTWVASLGSPWLGFLIFFTLSLGLGLPLCVLAVFSGQLEKLPHSGEWMVWVRKLMGWVLVGLAAYFLRPVLPQSAGVFVLAGVALAAGVHLGWLERSRTAFRVFGWLRTAAGAAGLVVGVFLIGSWFLRGPGVNWQPYSAQVLAEARQENKPVILDFTAEWCSPCRALEEETFHHPEVVRRAGEEFVLVKVDLTRKGNPVYQGAVRRFGVKGVPTVVFLDQEGRERRDLRLVDFLPPEKFLQRMTALQEGAGLAGGG